VKTNAPRGTAEGTSANGLRRIAAASPRLTQS
jgi:hypothetical protein